MHLPFNPVQGRGGSRRRRDAQTSPCPATSSSSPWETPNCPPRPPERGNQHVLGHPDLASETHFRCLYYKSMKTCLKRVRFIVSQVLAVFLCVFKCPDLPKYYLCVLDKCSSLK